MAHDREFPLAVIHRQSNSAIHGLAFRNVLGDKNTNRKAKPLSFTKSISSTPFIIPLQRKFSSMALNPLHEAHIRRVDVTFELAGADLDPVAVSAALGVKPDDSACRGDVRRNLRGQLLYPHKEGWWALKSEEKVNSKDVNDHFHYLLELLLPHQECIRELSEECKSSFGVLWQSTYLYAGTGPMIRRDIIAGVAALGARMAFDIYQIDEPESENTWQVYEYESEEDGL